MTALYRRMDMANFSLEGQTHECGGVFAIASEPGSFRIHGVDVPVTHHFYRCSVCAEELVTEELAAAVQSEASSAFRAQHRFLAGPAIRAIRERLGLKQDQLEAALGLGAKSLARWENERVLQNRSMDDLFRLIDRDRSCVVFLAQLHGATLPDHPALRRAELVDSARWPRQLVLRLADEAAAEGTDLQSYLIYLLTEYTTAGAFAHHAQSELSETARRFRQIVSRPHGTVVAGIEEEPWKRDHIHAMREARAASRAHAA